MSSIANKTGFQTVTKHRQMFSL